MNRAKLILVLFVAFLVSCQTQTKESSQKNIEKIKEKITFSKSPVKKDMKKISEITETELQTLVEGSKIGRVLVFRRDSVFEISSDKTLTYAILGNNNSVESLQERFDNIFKEEHKEIKNEMFEKPQIVSKLLYKESFIKTYFNSEVGKNDIVSGKITDREIVLAKGIHIGESKKDFFAKIFMDAPSYDFSEVDTFYNGDEMGEIHQYFIFRADTLRQVLIKSEYEWIPFD